MDEQILYGSVKGFFETFLYFQDPRYYDVITAWALHTWHIRRWRATGPLLLIGPVNSGKTTVLECLEELAYRGVRGGSMSNSTMFRLSHEYTPTLLVDESQIYAREEWAETQAFLNERYRKGGRVWRMVGEGTGMVPKFFDAYGATALAQSADTWDAMRSRAIVLKMEKGRPKEQTLTDLFYSEGAHLRAWLGQYQVRCFRQERQKTELDHKINTVLDGKQILENLGVESGLNPFPDPRPYMENLKDSRIREIGLPLLLVSPIDEPRESIQSYLEDLEKEHDAEDRTSYLADYVLALESAVKENGKASVKEVRIQLAVLWGLKTDSRTLPKPKTIMGNLRTLGFVTTRVSDGSTGVQWNEKLMERLRVRYRLQSASVSSVASEHEARLTAQSEGTEATEADEQYPMPHIVKKPYKCLGCKETFPNYQVSLGHKCEKGSTG
jgi:hypothetical protein